MKTPSMISKFDMQINNNLIVQHLYEDSVYQLTNDLMPTCQKTKMNVIIGVTDEQVNPPIFVSFLEWSYLWLLTSRYLISHKAG